jgi:hypothetical protein
VFSRKDGRSLLRYYPITLLPYYVLEVQAMRLHGVACAMRDFKRSLRPDAHMAKLWLVARHRIPWTQTSAAAFT